MIAVPKIENSHIHSSKYKVQKNATVSKQKTLLIFVIKKAWIPCENTLQKCQTEFEFEFDRIGAPH